MTQQLKNFITNWNKNFNKQQKAEIREGLLAYVNISFYAKPEFKAEQMREIRLGLEKDLDVTIYAKPELNEKQMEKVRLQLLKESTEK